MPSAISSPKAVPPHNSEAEQAFLGAILLDPEASSRHLNLLAIDDFYINANREVYAGIISLNEKNQQCDIITLCEELKATGTLDRVGGAGYIALLTSVTPSAANIEYYARIVKECATRRKLLRLSATIYARSEEIENDIGQLLDSIQAEIFAITQDRQILSYRTMKDLVHPSIDYITYLSKHKGQYTGIPSGFSDLDRMTSGFQNSEFIVIGARPSVGKTALALSMIRHIALQDKTPCALFSLEMSDTAIMLRLLSSAAQVSSHHLRTGLMKQRDLPTIINAASDFYEAPISIVDSPNLRLLELRTLARRLQVEQKVKIIFIDYLTLITHENSDLPRWEQIAAISRSLKSLARELNIPIVALSQLKRETEGRQPNLADLRESGSIEQDADLILLLHRDSEANRMITAAGNQEDFSSGSKQNSQEPYVVHLLVAKQRNGPIGKVDLTFNPQYARFYSVERATGNDYS